jgi:hypothetical protein
VGGVRMCVVVRYVCGGGRMTEHLQEQIDEEIETLLLMFQTNFPKHRLTIAQERMIAISVKSGVALGIRYSTEQMEKEE